MTTLYVDDPHGGMIVHRIVEVHIEVPVAGSASNGAILDKVLGIMADALKAAKVNYSVKHTSVHRDEPRDRVRP